MVKTNKVSRPAQRVSQLRFLQFNVFGLRGKETEVNKMLVDKNIDVAFLQETLLNRGAGLTRYRPPTGYTMYQCSCAGGGCRGLAALFKTSICVSPIPKPRSETRGRGNATDYCGYRVAYNGQVFKLYNVYQPGRSLVRLPVLTGNNNVLAGDFNAWSPRFGYPKHDAVGLSIEKFIDRNGLSHPQGKNSLPTFIRRGARTRPDLTLISPRLFGVSSTVVLPGCGSDHLPVLTVFSFPSSRSARSDLARPTCKFIYKRANWAAFSAECDKSFEGFSTLHGTVDDLARDLTAIIRRSARLHIPRVVCRGQPKSDQPWSRTLTRLKNRRNALRFGMGRRATPRQTTLYRSLSRELSTEIKRLKRRTWSETTSSLDPRRKSQGLYRLMRILQGDSEVPLENAPLRGSHGLVFTNFGRAQFLNRRLCQIGSDIPRTPDRDDLHRERLATEGAKAKRHNQSLFSKPFTLHELEDAIRRTTPGRSPGADGISYEMFKHLSTVSLRAVLALINKTWRDGEVPEAWREAIVTLIPKRGKDPQDISGYRPISITSCLSKIAERMVNSRLNFHLESARKLSPYQFGFRSGRQAIDPVVRLVQHVREAFVAKHNTGAVFFDLANAYDRVDPSLLLLKLLHKGVGGQLYYWLKSFLLHRRLRTSFHSAVSHRRLIKLGVPQGSPLSCSLFNVFIDDIVQGLGSKASLYADDLVIYHSAKGTAEIENMLRRDVDAVLAYCRRWQLKVNATKTCYHVFSLSVTGNNLNLNLDVGGVPIPLDEHPKYLGVTLDRKKLLSQKRIQFQ